MIFVLLLFACLLGVGAHLSLSSERSLRRAASLTLDWLLIGYCGLPQVVIAVWNLADPALAPRILGFPVGNPFQVFLGWAYLGMSLSAVLVLVFRGEYRIGPAVAWAVFFGGATTIHVGDAGGLGAMSHADVLHVFGTHGLISLLLIGALLTSGVLLPERATAARVNSAPAI